MIIMIPYEKYLNSFHILSA